MQKRVYVCSWFLFLLLTAPSEHSALQNQPNRLVVDNRTPWVCDLYAWRWNGQAWNWTFVMNINPRSWAPLFNVQNGENFRAVLPNFQRDHTVRLVYDRSYGGWQDVWWVQ